MNVRERTVGTLAALLLAAGTVLVTGPPASATSSAGAINCDSYREFVGSGGHAGASIRCRGGAFTLSVKCKMTNGYIYTHYGTRATSGGTSTVWCDLNASVFSPTVLPS